MRVVWFIDQLSLACSLSLSPLCREQMELAESVGLVEHFKLYSQISLNNMHLFDKDGKIRRFECPLEIIDEFFPLR